MIVLDTNNKLLYILVALPDKEDFIITWLKYEGIEK